MNVFQVKDAIKKTECAELVFSGGFCSEPIMSKDSNGELIDNYVVFSRNEDCSLISSPLCLFGIYTHRKQVVYIDRNISNQYQKHMYEESFEEEETMREACQVYLKLFPDIRTMFQTENNINNEKVLLYLDVLRIISGDTLFSYYEQLFPYFFDWAAKI